MNIEEIKGLSSAEVERAHEKFGYNELPDKDKKSLLKIILEIATEPMIFLLIAVVVVYSLLGDKTEATVLAISVLVIITIELYQNHKTEKALQALRNLSSPICDVIRDGKKQTIPGREVVVGDIVLIAEGGRVPADGLLITSQNLMVDESLLTGESVPIDKNIKETIYSSSMVVKGHALFEVTAIGSSTEVGKIGTSLNAIENEKTLLKKEIERVVKIIAIGAVFASLLLTIVYWLTRGDLLNGFLAGLTLSIAILPEEFPVVLTVFMALGAWRLAKNNVLARKSQTIETLGSATVLCTDKTGTLTENDMAISSITDATGKELEHGVEAYIEIVAYGVLASQIKPFDPMEEAFINAANMLGNTKDIYRGIKLKTEYPLDETSLSVVHIWHNSSDKMSKIGLKGAPEEVFRLCKLSRQEREELHGRVKVIASNGLRVIGVAKGKPQNVTPKKRDELEFTFLGLVALADPIRKEVPDAVKLCRQAGIRVIIITGDFSETARRIGKEIGLDSQNVLTGHDLSMLSEKEKQLAIKNTSIFCRVSPTDKLSIVGALKKNGEVVAMTGDGVNDAPALKSAHIGVAMGKRGTDVAREASSIVLLDDNFASIVQGVRIGRRIFTNLQKAMAYLITVHIPITVLSFMPVVFGWPIVLLPIHIVFLEFIIDPSCTLIFEGESEEPDAMKRPPRHLKSPLFSRAVLLRSLLQGAVISSIILAVHGYMLWNGWQEDKARSITFLLIVLTNLMLILAISGRRVVEESFSGGFNAMVAVISIVSLSLVAVYSIPALERLFKIAPISFTEVTITLGISLLIALSIMPLQRKFRF